MGVLVGETCAYCFEWMDPSYCTEDAEMMDLADAPVITVTQTPSSFRGFFDGEPRLKVLICFPKLVRFTFSWG